jgi:hypothetical protein
MRVRANETELWFDVDPPGLLGATWPGAGDLFRAVDQLNGFR